MSGSLLQVETQERRELQGRLANAPKKRRPPRPGPPLFRGCSRPRHPESRLTRNSATPVAGTTSTFAIPGDMDSDRPSPAYDRVVERRQAVALARHFREAEGLSIAQIAERLGRSPATVRAYFYDPSDANKRPTDSPHANHAWPGCPAPRAGLGF
jgi:hypothetical protein